MSEAYVRAIDLIAQPGGLDWRQVCLEIAKSKPEVFVEAADKAQAMSLTIAEPTEPSSRADLFALPTDSVFRSVQSMVADGRKVEAIKAIRALTGWGLKEAKDWVDGVADKVSREVLRDSSLAAAFDGETMKLGELLKGKLTGRIPVSADRPLTPGEALNWAEEH